MTVMLTGLLAALVSLPADGGASSSASDARATAFDTYLAWVRAPDSSLTPAVLAAKALLVLGRPDWARRILVTSLNRCMEWEKASPDNVCSDVQALLSSLPETSVAVDGGVAQEGALDGKVAQSTVDAAVEERLRAPALWRSYRIIDVKPGKRVRRAPVRLPVPQDDAVFAAREGRRAVVVTTSTDVDPRGETSMGGYVVYLSGDAGATWRGPFHTGFAAGFPFRLRDNGGAPVFDGDALQLPVDMEEIDPASIEFSWAAVSTKESRRNCIVRIPQSALEKDTDGDGLPDLLEERLATDPRSADTDGDGVPDAWDAYPLQQGSTVGPEGRFLAAALRAPMAFSPAIVHAPGGELEIIPRRATQAPTAWVWGRTRFLVDAPMLPGSSRVVSLSRHAVDAYAKKLGPIFPIRVTTLVSDGHRAVVELNESWCGSTSLVEEQADGTFSVSLIRKWVS